MEQMDCNLLLRRFAGLGTDDAVGAPTGFTQTRGRLLTADRSRGIMAAKQAHRGVAPLLSDDHFPVDAMSAKARAPMKSFEPLDNAVPDRDGAPGDRPDGVSRA